jgi:hypothetical protein
MFHFVDSEHWASAMKVGAGRGDEKKNGQFAFFASYCLRVSCV